MEFIYMQMVKNMKDFGKMICTMDLEQKHGLMDPDMKEIMSKEKRKDMVI